MPSPVSRPVGLRPFTSPVHCSGSCVYLWPFPTWCSCLWRKTRTTLPDSFVLTSTMPSMQTIGCWPAASSHTCCAFFCLWWSWGYCYTTVIITLCQSQRSLEKQGAIRLALLVTLVFCLCWLPYNITIFMHTLVVLGAVPESCHTRNTLKQAIIVTESIGFSHCCLNPILYAFIGVRFRRDLLQLLAKIKCLRVCLSGQRTKNSNRVSVSEAVTTTTSSQYI